MAILPTPAQLRRATDEGWADWIVTRQDEIAVARGCYFDLDAALRTRAFFESCLTHGKAPFAGQPFILLDWQWHEVIGPTYGWKMPDGSRRHLSAFIFIPKKNGKTQLAAGIALRELFDQYGARVAMAANSREQLTVDGCFEEATGMVERNQVLSESLEVIKSKDRIVDPARNSVAWALPAAAASSEGKNLSALIFEELHAWTDRDLYNSLLYSDAAREDSFQCTITTAGAELSSVCYEEYERACRIRDGKDLAIDHLAVIYEAPKRGKWDDLETWKKANPSYGVTLPERKIQRAIDQAKGSPQRVAALRRYRLNQWVRSKDSWLSREKWDGCGRIDPEYFRGREVFGGLDLARVRDFAALARLHRAEGSDVVDVGIRIWIPEDLIADKEVADKIPLSDWVERGFVTPTPGDEIDYGFIRRDILAMHAESPFVILGYDPYNAAHLCNQQLGDEDGMNVIEVPQTMPHMCGPSAEWERLLNAGNLRHEGNEALGWMVENAITATDQNENFRPVKRRSRGRIDGLIACLIGLARLTAPDNPNRRNFYDDHEAEFV